jgi:hypothetical protein
MSISPLVAVMPTEMSQGQRPSPAATGLARGAASGNRPDNLIELFQPGSFVKLRNQPSDLPPFQLIQCRGGRCWVRQQAWGSLVHWEVAHQQLTAAA